MVATRRGAVVSAVLLPLLALGAFLLVRFGMGDPLDRTGPPITSSSEAPPRTDDSGPLPAESTGTAGDPASPAPSTESSAPRVKSTGAAGDSDGPPPPENSSPAPAYSTRSTTSSEPPPRPAVPLSSVGGVGPRAVLPAGGSDGEPGAPKVFGLRVVFGVTQAFSVQVRVVDVNVVLGGQYFFIDHPAGEDVTKCDRGTIEPGEVDIPLCVVDVNKRELESAPSVTGKLELVVQATCTSTTGRPCESLPESYAPSPDNPIDVVWSCYSEEWSG